MRKLIATLVSAAALPYAVFAQGNELVKNGSFEDVSPNGSAKHWHRLGAINADTNSVVESAAPDGGKYSYRLGGVPGKYTAVGQGIKGYQTASDFKRPLKISVWMKTEDISSVPSEGEAVVALWGSAKGRNAGQISIAKARGTTPWTEYSVTVTPEQVQALEARLKPENRPLNLTLRANIYNQKGMMWIDRVSCVELEEASLTASLDSTEFSTAQKSARLSLESPKAWTKATVSIGNVKNPHMRKVEFSRDNNKSFYLLNVGELEAGDYTCIVEISDDSGKSIGQNELKIKIIPDPFN
jgi:hypothetical protein